jgi:SEC-C motif
MSRKRNEKKKKRLSKETQRLTGKTRIDERFQYGPLELVRAGKSIIMRNNSTPEQQAEMLKALAVANKEALKELGTKVEELQEIISKYDPLDLMHRAGYMALSLLMEGKTESELTSDQNKVLPSIEYLQYLISRTVGNPKAKEPTEAEWSEVWEGVVGILDITSTYLSTRAPKGKNSAEIESLVQSLDLMRLIVRVNRFPGFLEDYWRSSFEPYNSLLVEEYGITATQVIDGLKQLSNHQQRGVMAKHIALRDAVAVLRKRATELGLKEEDTEEYRAQIQASPELKRLHEDTQEKLNEAMTVKLFEITNVSSLPKPVLSLLSVRPGEEPISGVTGPNNEDLSPLSTDILHYKPFLEVDGKFYTFYHSGFEDRMGEIIEADLNQKHPKKRTAIEKIRSNYIEKEAVELISGIISPTYTGRNLYYPNPDQEGHFTELDGLVEVDDVLILIEVKSGGISAATSRGAPGSLETDLKSLIFEGQRQSERAERYIKSADQVDFYEDSTRKKVIYQASYSKYRKVFRVVVTREQLGWVGADLAKLSVVDPSLNDSMPWQVSLDDLRAIAVLFKGKGITFSHYLEVRLEAATSKALSQKDEIDHVSLYNAMNYYHKNIEEGANRMTFNAYGLEIDKYFIAIAAGEELEVPKQKIPKELHLLLDALNRSNVPHRYEIGSFLLGNDGIQGKEVAKHIRKLLAEKSATGYRIVRLIAKDLDLGVSISEVIGQGWEQEELRCALFMERQGVKRWLSVQVEKTDNGLNVSRIVELKADDYSAEQLKAAHVKLERDLEKNIAKQKIAQNQQCPCGSGERFKNCHGKRNA